MKEKMWTVWDNTTEDFCYEDSLLDEYSIPVKTTKLCGVFSKQEDAKKLVDEIFATKTPYGNVTSIHTPDEYGYKFGDEVVTKTHEVVAVNQSLTVKICM